MIRIPGCHYHGPDSVLGRGTKILQAMQHGQNKKKSSRLFLSRLQGEISITSDMQGEGNGTPLQYSCLENPMDGGPGGLPSMGH